MPSHEVPCGRKRLCVRNTGGAAGASRDSFGPSLLLSFCLKSPDLGLRGVSSARGPQGSLLRVVLCGKFDHENSTIKTWALLAASICSNEGWLQRRSALGPAPFPKRSLYEELRPPESNAGCAVHILQTLSNQLP